MTAPLALRWEGNYMRAEVEIEAMKTAPSTLVVVEGVFGASLSASGSRWDLWAATGAPCYLRLELMGWEAVEKQSRDAIERLAGRVVALLQEEWYAFYGVSLAS